jgi:signal transduction histidine kinase/DNA-binding response OmpR family regulator/ligand-binding sensor domain-containing protein
MIYTEHKGFSFKWHSCAIALMSFMLFLLSPSVSAQQRQYPVETGRTLSNLHVESIVQDSTGFMWIGTSRGLNRYDGYNYTYFYSYANNDKSIITDEIMHLFVTNEGAVCSIGPNGFSIYDRDSNTFRQYRLKRRTFVGAVQEVNHELYFITDYGFMKLNMKSGKYTVIKYFTNAKGMCADAGNRLWIVVGDKVIIYNTAQGSFKPIGLSGVQRIYRGPSAKTLFCVYKDHIDLIDVNTCHVVKRFTWKGNIAQYTYNSSSGRSMCFMTDKFDVYSYNKVTGTFDIIHVYGVSSIFNVTSLYVDNHRNVWVGTFDSGFRFISTSNFNFDVDADLSQNFKDIFVTSLTGDGGNRMWIGTRGNGAWEFNRATNRATRILNTEMIDIRSSVANCFHDSRGLLWIGAVDGLYCYDTSGGATRKISEDKSLYNVRYITEDREGNLWILLEAGKSVIMMPRGTTNKTYPFNVPSNSSAMYITQLRSGEYAFSLNGLSVYVGRRGKPYTELIKTSNQTIKDLLAAVTYIYEDSKGQLWLGSYRLGLLVYNPKTHKLRHFTRQSGLPSNDILSITEDCGGTIWLSTSFGLSCTTDGSSFVNYFTGSGLLGNQFHERSIYVRGDTIYFSGNHGITSFISQQIKGEHRDIPIIIQSLTTEKKEYNIYCTSTSEVDLSYHENTIMVDFVGLDYASSENLLFSYKLEGYDKSWSAPSALRQLNYANLKPGTYKLKVRLNNNSERVVTLVIKIPRSPWTSWWALFIYAIIIGFVAYKILNFYIESKMSHEKIRLSEETLAKERELNQAKINFFENVSHELRTPLSLIYGTYCDIMSRGAMISKTGKEMFSLMGSNIERLRTLVEQILAFSRLGSETLSLAVDKINLTQLAENVINRFGGERDAKNIILNFTHPADDIVTMADADKVDKAITNLLSNAFKYTPINGRINVKMRLVDADEVREDYKAEQTVASRYVEIVVCDTGVGVPQEDVEHIFERFYRSKSKENNAVHGSGIGLYYVKCLIAKHKGFIKVKLNEDIGSCFSFVIPYDATYDASEIGKKHPEEKEAVVDNVRAVPDIVARDNAEEKPKYQLLIVDDETDMQIMLDRLLTPYYNITRAYNGDDAFQIAVEEIPDIILSDVMMPGMNGFDLCAKIKHDERVSHVPVVLLTAKSEMSDRMSGVDAGADGYIAKPFNPSFLIKMLSTVMENRERVQRMLLRVGDVPEAERVPEENVKKDNRSGLRDIDARLLEQFNAKIEAKLEDADFSIDEIAAELNFKRSTFYRKIKGLTGQSPNDYILVYRVKRAVQLIRSGEYSLYEVSDMTGFSSQSYFSVIFKKFVGMTPSDYKNSLQKD